MIDTTHEIALMQSMTENQRLLFTTEMNGLRKNRTTALLLTLFLGGVGAQHFYLGKVGLGVLSACCFWTFVPLIWSVIDLFLVMGRTDRHNAQQADAIAAKVKMLGAPATA